MLLDMLLKKFGCSLLVTCLVVFVCYKTPAQTAQVNKDGFVLPAATGEQTETDEYTRYELLAPETASFRIYYELTATTAGARLLYNPIRKGSIASDESVMDAMTGKPVHFEVVHGSEAKKDPLIANADEGTDYIKVTLARPVPEHGQGRVVILKTYKDAKSYYMDGSTLVFNRPLGVNAIRWCCPRDMNSWAVPSRRRY
jgi:hypothetical protein